mgnify:CR=1 FL=1
MALPIVTYGKYNYGQYANPTPIRYKGGFGEALTGAVQAISTAEKKKKAQFKEAQETSLMMSMQFSSQLNTAFGKAAATNRKFLRDLKQEYGDTVKSYKLGNLSFDDYEDRMTYYQNILDQSMQLAGIMKPIIESDTDVTFDMARSDDDNQAATLARHGVRKGLYILERDEDGMRVVLPHGPSASNYEPKSIAASELITNTKYINPQLKYDNMRNEKYGVMLGKVADNLKNKTALLTSRIEKDLGAKVFSLDSNSKDAIINEIMKREDLLNIFNDNEEKEIYYEDEIGGLGSWNGNEDQLKAIKLQLANNMYNSLLGKDISATKYVPPTQTIIDQRTGLPMEKSDLTALKKERLLNLEQQNYLNQNKLAIYQASFGNVLDETKGSRGIKKQNFNKSFKKKLDAIPGLESDFRPFDDGQAPGSIEIKASTEHKQKYGIGKGGVYITPGMSEQEINNAIYFALGFDQMQSEKAQGDVKLRFGIDNPTLFNPSLTDNFDPEGTIKDLRGLKTK